MPRKQKDIDTLAVMKRFGDGSCPSIREVAREFGIAESTLRGMMATSARLGLPWPRDYALHMATVIAARLEQSTYELGELRKLLLARMPDELRPRE
jgi:hypothetical protein